MSVCCSKVVAPHVTTACAAIVQSQATWDCSTHTGTHHTGTFHLLPTQDHTSNSLHLREDPSYSDIPPLSRVQTCSLCGPYIGKRPLGIRLKCFLISSHVEEFICSFLFRKLDSRFVPWTSSTILSSDEPFRNALLILRESLSLQYT